MVSHFGVPSRSAQFRIWGSTNTRTACATHTGLFVGLGGLAGETTPKINLGQKQLLSVTLYSQSQTIYASTNEDMYSIRVSPPEPVESSQSGLAPLAPATEGSCTAEAKVEMMVHAGPPHKMSTLSVIDGCLFAFGGKDQDNQLFATVCCYNPETNSWQRAGSMLSSRYGVAISTVK